MSGGGIRRRKLLGLKFSRSGRRFPSGNNCYSGEKELWTQSNGPQFREELVGGGLPSGHRNHRGDNWVHLGRKKVKENTKRFLTLKLSLNNIKLNLSIKFLLQEHSPTLPLPPLSLSGGSLIPSDTCIGNYHTLICIPSECVQNFCLLIMKR